MDIAGNGSGDNEIPNGWKYEDLRDADSGGLLKIPIPGLKASLTDGDHRGNIA